ncbi:MAG: TlpA family protein disulfide reductase [Pyrinomonadaceae bacterium]
MNLNRFKQYLDVVTNVFVVLLILAAFAVGARQYFRPKERPFENARLSVGTVFPAIPELNYGRTPKTVLLALNIYCKYCVESIPFYQRLAQAQKENESSFQLAAIFLNKETDAVRNLVREKELSVLAIPNVDFSIARISTTPTIALLDNNGKVLNSWVGELSEEREKEVFAAIGVPFKARIESAPPGTSAVNRKKTIDVFDEYKPLLSIDPPANRSEREQRFVNFFDVDSQGNIYLLDPSGLLVFDSHGNITSSRPLPKDFKPPVSVSDGGKIYSPTQSGIAVYNFALQKERDISLEGVITPQSRVLKMTLDRARNQLYLQVYDQSRPSQKLLRLDLETSQAKEVFDLKDPVRFNPNYTPGAFDFAVGSRYLYVSDIREYKVSMYSLESGALIKTLNRPDPSLPIRPEDGDLLFRKVQIDVKNGLELRDYPPIVHLNFSNKKRLLVWSSGRDATHRQLVEVYDEDLRFIGVDFKYAHPSMSNYIFANGKVYAPDFGFGKEVKLSRLSPLEVPMTPLAIKVFSE